MNQTRFAKTVAVRAWREAEREREQAGNLWDEPTLIVERPQFVAPVIDLERMARIEDAMRPRVVRVNAPGGSA